MGSVEHILGYLINKGLAIGAAAGSLHILKAWRTQTFTARVAITDILGSTLAGAFTWRALQSSELGEGYIAGITFMVAADIFIILAVISNPAFIKKSLMYYFRIRGKDDDESG